MQFDIYKYLPGLCETIPERTFWAHKIIHQIDNDKHNNYIITDIRFNHELTTIKQYCTSNNTILYIVKIIRPNNPYITQVDKLHLSRAEINIIPEEYITHTIINDGDIHTFCNKIKAFYNSFNLYQLNYI